MMGKNRARKPKKDDIYIIDNKEYITVAVAATLYDYNGRYLRRLLRQGKLQGRRFGSQERETDQWLVDLEHLQAYVKDKRKDRRGG
jgi:hypothetical protein